ncbi:5'-nucleotidase C-terminal domain-containing protein [Aneurinibacillus tyrosinisolvens]|uniref:5'-nucleotidase C-terminal domain-containing protein n=1 Tax=Aneurinibacillus tyrosinisolvens TaxID=1443435 RepID=UPI000699EA26|nr:5'-nucleotidase C-terminal domain-containing protein [Aneurinibacillus tyrosinisolvens]
MGTIGKKFLALSLGFTLSTCLLPLGPLPSVNAETVAATDLFISEYVEGSGNNKAIEIYNGTGSTVDLSQYTLELYSNGATTPGSKLSLTGNLENGKVYVISHSSAADQTIKNVSNATSSVANFNGNDALVLKHNEQIIDVLGKVGEDPGTKWGTSPTSTLDNTLVRKSSVTAGDTNPNDAFDPSIEWEGFAKDTVANLGSHTMNGGIQPGQGGSTPTPETPPATGTFSIADAKQKGSGQAVTVEGIVTADNSAIGGGKLSTYIQDNTAGVNLFSSTLDGFPDLKEGDKVRVEGTLTSYKSLTEIKPARIEVVSSNEPVPAAQDTTLVDLQSPQTGEPLEGKLVKLSAYVKEVPAAPSAGGYNVTIYDEQYNSTTLRVMEGTGIYQNLQAGKWYDITAVVSQYDSYQLVPRKSADMVVAATQKEAPKPASSYSSTIVSIVDGDTVHLSTPILGSTKVRMLSIDTPETNYEGKSQGYHAEQAKAELQRLLPAGTEVEIEVGQDPLDNYGRLLAHIHVKSSGLDVNKEMVRLGRAVPYFIWPNMEHFEEYSAAAKEAIDNGRGLWDPANPIPELPYEFRFNLRSGPDKYVGDYFTKKYVEPAQWKSIPAQNRVFFFTEQDAKTAGYTMEGNTTPVPQGNIKVQLLGLNDLHGKIDQQFDEKSSGDINGDNVKDATFGRMDYVAAYMKQREATNPNTLLVHAGDAVGGSSPMSALLQDEPTVEIMESMGFDVGTIGNHELDEGTGEMLRLIRGGQHPKGTENYDGMNFPLIAANVVYKNTGETVLPPYTIKEINGTKIGFIGVVTKSAAGMVMPEGIKDIQFTDETAAVNKAVAELKQQGVKAIAVLAHMDAEQSGTTVTGPAATLANTVDDEVDVIFAAHNHKIVNGTVDNKLIVQAGEYGKAFSDVDLEIDPATKDIVKKSAEIVYVNQKDTAPDPTVSNILEKYKNRVAPIINEVVGEAAFSLTGGYGVKGPVGDNALGNLIADGMKAAMNSDFALMNGGGIRQGLDAGPITWGDLFNIQPFNNVLTKLEIKGADLRTILNAQLSKQYGPDYSVAGFKYTYDEATQKVVNIFLPDGSKIDENATYTVTVNNFMATSTGGKYKPIGQLGKNPITGSEDLEATVNFVKSLKGPIAYKAEGRISDGSDTTAPVTTVNVTGQSGAENYNNHDVTLTFEANDGTGTGVERTEYRIDGSEWIAVNGEVKVTEEGIHPIEYRSTDKAGNVENAKKIVVAIDKTSPIIKDVSQLKLFQTDSYNVNVEAADTGSGMKEVTVTLDGKPVSSPSVLGALEFSPGEHTISVVAIDKAGNKSEKTFTLYVVMDVAHLDELVAYGVESNFITNHGIANSLLAKVKSAQKDEGDAKKVLNSLNALRNEIKAQTGKKITASFAGKLLEDISFVEKTYTTK